MRFFFNFTLNNFCSTVLQVCDRVPLFSKLLFPSLTTNLELYLCTTTHRETQINYPRKINGPTGCYRCCWQITTLLKKEKQLGQNAIAVRHLPVMVGKIWPGSSPAGLWIVLRIPDPSEVRSGQLRGKTKRYPRCSGEAEQSGEMCGRSGSSGGSSGSVGQP